MTRFCGEACRIEGAFAPEAWVGNGLILHHFSDEALRDLGAGLQSFRSLTFCETPPIPPAAFPLQTILPIPE